MFLTNKPFGGFSVFTSGDFYPLPPVKDYLIFMNPNTGYLALLPNTWQEYFQMFNLTEIMRHKGKDFAEVLNWIRVGQQTADILYINKQTTSNGEESTLSANIARFYCSNKAVNNYNQNIFEKISTVKRIIMAKDSVVGNVCDYFKMSILQRVPSDPKKTEMLFSQLHLGCKLPFDITINCRQEDALINGTLQK